MKSKFMWMAALSSLAGVSAAAEAYSFGTPELESVSCPVFVAEAGFLAPTGACPVAACSSRDDNSPNLARYALASAEVGFTWERQKPQYYLADRLDAPADVDWQATLARFAEQAQAYAAAREAGDAETMARYAWTRDYVVDANEIAPGVHVVRGGNVRFEWVLGDGSLREMSYVVSCAGAGRPKRIFWTDVPYNAPTVSLVGKFVRLFGNDDLLTLRYGSKVYVSGGSIATNDHAVVRGLYVDELAQTLYAAGDIAGQCVLVYYDSGNYDTILGTQVVEVRAPEVVQRRATVGQAVHPSGQGYSIEGLKPKVTAGIGNTEDDRGDYLYQHTGQYSYSPKNGEVYAIRPNVGARWKAEIYWMETDSQGVQWPFELDQYEIEWPDVESHLYVRGNERGDCGRSIYLPTEYSVSVERYQEPDGHALMGAVNNCFYTTGEGWSLLRLTTDDNIWFMPVCSVMRTNPRYFTLKSSAVKVGYELRPGSGTRSGLASNVFLKADASLPGYVYEAASAGLYDFNLYLPVTNAVSAADSSAEDLRSAVFAIAQSTNRADNTVEVWWNRPYQVDDMPYPVIVPMLPQRYHMLWPEPGEMPQIVIASQQGSASETLHHAGFAACFDSPRAHVRLEDRRYFADGGSGTVAFWTRPAVYADAAVARRTALSALVSFGGDALCVYTADETVFVEQGGRVLMQASLAGRKINAWTHLAITFADGQCQLYVDGNAVGAPVPIDVGRLTGQIAECYLGARANVLGTVAGSHATVTEGRQMAELSVYRRALSAAEIKESRYARLLGNERGLSGYLSFEDDEDFVLDVQRDTLRSTCLDRAGGNRCETLDVVLREPGAPVRSSGVIASDEEPSVYYQNDRNGTGYNPNEEHAFVTAGGGGYVTWALRSDLNTDTSSRPLALVEYMRNGRLRMQAYEVVVTNADWPVLGGTCEVGLQLPGPQPFLTFGDPWLAEDYWDAPSKGRSGPAYRDRKGQVWARTAGTLAFRKYYRMQEGFWFPQLADTAQPAVGDPIPWLALLQGKDVLKDPPVPWTWTVSWPENVPEMRIGQTLTEAADGLPGIWDFKSAAVVYPTDQAAAETVLLSDPTVMQSVPLAGWSDLAKKLAEIGLSTGQGGGLTLRNGKYTFDELPPHLSGRVYLDTTTKCLCLTGLKEEAKAGVGVLYPNVLTAAERETLVNVVPEGCRVVDDKKTAWTEWCAAVGSLAPDPVEPNRMTEKTSVHGQAGKTVTELCTSYAPIDHYALTALGTNYVVIVENDASNAVMNVQEGDPVSMHVIRIVPKYYKGRIVTREDERNLLSQRLSVLYTDPIGGRSDDFTFEWRKASPNANGTIPDAYDNEQVYRLDVNHDDRDTPRITIGQQGDTLDSMVNGYWICRYRAKENTPAWKTMGDAWSEWCAPPALAEGWVQRVLNNVTPFNQRMTDLYENQAETPVSMIRIAGRPYEGDVALNQETLNSVGLIELYETIFNKAESMSILLGKSNADACKQLMLCAERLDDLYVLLGDEAYSDAKNPTIGFGSNMSLVENWPDVDFGAASTSLFCFDNQVRTLLDEELALLRGRTGDSAPGTTLSPYYNRLVWNFTKGITAGEVAYAVNYNIAGTQNGTLTEEEAAVLYPQGHGDAYGHYLSALTGWYRLLRNPNFNWARSQGEMVLADAAANVDYYEEAKFAAAAAKLAKTAADCVDLTARASWRDNRGDMNANYEDSNTNRAFGVGEWANRGAYGALVNWMVANSMLPEHEDAPELQRIDRGTVSELDELCSAAATVLAASDRVDTGLNPLGLANTAVPFDITPIGASDGTATHFEQIRARAGTAMANAKKVLDEAQRDSNRLRMIQESAESYADSIADQELAYKHELISIFGTPFAGDIGPGKTYVQGYDGPDIFHYMWVDLSKYEVDGNEIAAFKTNSVIRYSGLKAKSTFEGVLNAEVSTMGFSYEINGAGIVMKPNDITGTRTSRGSIQDKYDDFILAYLTLLGAEKGYNNAVKGYEVEREYLCDMVERYKDIVYYKEVVSGLNMAFTSLEAAGSLTEAYGKCVSKSAETGWAMSIVGIPELLFVGMGTLLSPGLTAWGVDKYIELTGEKAEAYMAYMGKRMQSTAKVAKTIAEEAQKIRQAHFDEDEKIHTYIANLRSAASEINSKAYALRDAYIQLNIAMEQYEAEVHKGELLLEERECARKKWANNLVQYRYNDMFFRLTRNEKLSRYTTSFDMVQKYVFLSAQAYDYETLQLTSDKTSGDRFFDSLIGSRSLGDLQAILDQMDQNWLVLKPRLGLNNPQPYATWFSLRRECFRILPGEDGDAAWAKELRKHWVDDLMSNADVRRHCQPFQSQYGLKAQEPGLIIPFETTIDFARNFFGQDLAGDDANFDSTWNASRIAAAGVWFDGYNGRENGYKGQVQLGRTPVAYLVPVGLDCMRLPGKDEDSVVSIRVTDQVIPAPFAIGSTYLDDLNWYPSVSDGDWGGADASVRLRRHPSFRAYFDPAGGEPDNACLDATRLVGRSVWNTQWLLVIPAGGMNADREKALSVFIDGLDANRDGKRDLTPVSDIRIGFRTYSTSGN